VKKLALLRRISRSQQQVCLKPYIYCELEQMKGDAGHQLQIQDQMVQQTEQVAAVAIETVKVALVVLVL
jgi:hypothetical protein